MADQDRIDELLEFFRFGQADFEKLARVRSALDENADRFVTEFRDHLLRFEPTRDLLENEQVLQRVLESQQAYLRSLAEPAIDVAYVEKREAIGVALDRLGLDTRWFLGAYSLYFDLLVPVVRASAGEDAADFDSMISALGKRLFLDSELALRQYVDRREEDLNKLNTDLSAATQALASQVDSTTRDLRRSQARAVAAERLAAAATLISGLAHEIGTPMGVLRGHAEALEGAVEGERAKWRLQMILEQIDRITNIMQSLLDFAHPRESVTVSLNLQEIAEASLAFLAEKRRRRNIAVEFSSSPQPAILGDPEKMQQVFLNLLINSIDAMPEGGTLGVMIGGQAGVEAEVRISDTGEGIDKAHLDRIFDPFFTTKAAGHGSGLGLVVARDIIVEAGGTIRVTSSPRQGTEFIITIPTEGTEVDAEANEAD